MSKERKSQRMQSSSGYWFLFSKSHTPPNKVKDKSIPSLEFQNALLANSQFSSHRSLNEIYGIARQINMS